MDPARPLPVPLGFVLGLSTRPVAVALPVVVSFLDLPPGPPALPFFRAPRLFCVGASARFDNAATANSSISSSLESFTHNPLRESPLDLFVARTGDAPPGGVATKGSCSCLEPLTTKFGEESTTNFLLSTSL